MTARPVSKRTHKDIAGRLQWKISPAQTLILDSSYSRQGNIYNGDTQTAIRVLLWLILWPTAKPKLPVYTVLLIP